METATEILHSVRCLLSHPTEWRGVRRRWWRWFVSAIPDSFAVLGGFLQLRYHWTQYMESDVYKEY